MGRRNGIYLGHNRHELNLLSSFDKLSSQALQSSKSLINLENRKTLLNIVSSWKSVCHRQAFSGFCELSLLPKKISESESISTIGSNFLDPFCFKSIDVIDEYSFSTNNGISNDTISSFCFPKGLKVRLIPRCVLENAKKLGWVGEGGDTYQILVFTNAFGEKCHGLSIIIREQRRAIRVLSDFWLKYRQNLTSRNQVLLK